MIKQSDGKIGTREFLALILITIGLKHTDMTATMLFPVGKTATWLMPFLSGLVTTASFLVLLALLKAYETKNIIEISYHVTGKVLGFLIGIILFLFMLTTTALYVRNHADIMGIIYFPETPTPVLLFLFLFVAFYIANRGIEAIGRTSWLTVPYLKVAFVFLLILIFGSIQWRNIYPLGGPGFTPLLYESTKESYLFAEIIFFSILFPFVRTYKNFRLASLLGLAITCLELMVFYIVYIMVYDFPAVENIPFPFQQLTRIADLGPVFGNMESFFIGFWAIASITRIAIYLFLTGALFAFTLKIKEFELLLLPIAGVVFFLAAIPISNIDSMLIMKESNIYQFSWFFILILPIILWIVDQVKKGRSYT